MFHCRPGKVCDGTPSPSSLEGNFGSGAGIAAAIPARRRTKQYGSKRARERTLVGMGRVRAFRETHRGGHFETAPSRPISSRPGSWPPDDVCSSPSSVRPKTSHGPAGGPSPRPRSSVRGNGGSLEAAGCGGTLGEVCDGMSNLSSPSALLRQNDGPALPVRGGYEANNHWPTSSQNNSELRISPSSVSGHKVDNYGPSSSQDNSELGSSVSGHEANNHRTSPSQNDSELEIWPWPSSVNGYEAYNCRPASSQDNSGLRISPSSVSGRRANAWPSSVSGHKVNDNPPASSQSNSELRTSPSSVKYGAKRFGRGNDSINFGKEGSLPNNYKVQLVPSSVRSRAKQFDVGNASNNCGDEGNESPQTDHSEDSDWTLPSPSSSPIDRGSDKENRPRGQEASRRRTLQRERGFRKENRPHSQEASRRRSLQRERAFRNPGGALGSVGGSICRKRSGVTGLRNLGNTCFMNSAIQCLAHTPSLADFFLGNDHVQFLSKNEKLARCFAEVVDKIYQNDDGDGYCPHRGSPCSPDDFLRRFTDDAVAPQFGGSSQHDSHEFLRVLIDQLCDDLKDEGRCQNGRIREVADEELDAMPLRSKADYRWKWHLAQNASFITDEFCGQLISTIQCSVCRTKKYCFDPFYDISLPFPAGNLAEKNPRRSSMLSMLSRRDPSPRCSLNDCLREFCRDEELDGENMIECGTCRGKRKSTKRLQVYRFPRALVLHLKRFGNERKKVQTWVDFPLNNFDAGPIAHAEATRADRASPIYDLYAVCDHSGRMNFGHYTAACIDAHTNSWYKFNDQHTARIDSSGLDGAGAYMLFYRLRESCGRGKESYSFARL